MPEYTVHARRNGKYAVEYQCGQCAAPLASPLEEAGQKFPCPTCGATVQTPGIKERFRQLEQEAEAERRLRQPDWQQPQNEPRDVAEESQGNAGGKSGALTGQTAPTVRPAALASRRILSSALILLLLAMLAIVYFAAIRPSLEKPAEPTMADFKSFGDRFVASWNAQSQSWWNARSQSSTDGLAPQSLECHIEITGTDKRRTDSVLNPVVWVLLAKDWETGSKPSLFFGSSDTFCFSWDGKRWRGVESTRKEDTAIGEGLRPADNIDRKLSADEVDAVAIKCQSP